MESDGKTKQKEYTAKFVLTLVFLGAFAAFTYWMLTAGPGLDGFQPTWIELFILGFATYRLGRLIAYDRVMEPFRQFFTTTGPDPTGAGDSVSPKGVGFQQSIGQLICCPICVGTWVASAADLYPDPVSGAGARLFDHDHRYRRGRAVRSYHRGRQLGRAVRAHYGGDQEYRARDHEYYAVRPRRILPGAQTVS